MACSSSEPAAPLDDASTAEDSSVDAGPDGAVGAEDDAVIVASTLPDALGCSEVMEAAVTVQNTGSTTWPAGGDFRLGAVDDEDPLSSGTTRVDVDRDVAPGESHEFALTLTGPGVGGVFTTDWQMVHDGVGWFGEVARTDVTENCASEAPDGFDLATVTIVASPDVRGFPITSRITSLEFSPGIIHIDHTLRGQWPPVEIDPDGTTQEATIWVFFHIDGVWYGTGGERLRPSQTDKDLTQPSDIGPGWLYDPNRWGVMTGYVPAPGETVGFMVVAGSTRSDDQTPVDERTGVVLVPFPADGETVAFPPFLWEEP